MFFNDGFSGPAPRAVEFRNDGCAAFYANLIDTVFITVERKKTAIREIAALLDGIQQGIGCQSGIINGFRVCLVRGQDQAMLWVDW